MNYHNITTDDMNNGEGLRTVLWVAGCNHQCKGCHNQITWDPNGGIEFDFKAYTELSMKLKPKYIAGLTISGGDPLMPCNRDHVQRIISTLKLYYPEKTIWIYTGYVWEELMESDGLLQAILLHTDVLVDGPFVESLKDVNYKWAGSTNQRVIDVQKSLKEGKVVLYDGK